MNKLQIAEQMRKALMMFTQTLPNDKAIEVPYIYEEWEAGRHYTTDTILRYGANDVGDPQLYRVEQDHTSQLAWNPAATRALYTPIGIDDSGYPIWAQPTGAHDAYDKGDVVRHKDELYISTIDANTYEPGVYGWEIYKEE